MQINMTERQYHIYRWIAKRHGKPLSQTDIANEFGITPQSVSRLLMRMERRGWIYRIPGIGFGIVPEK